MQHLWHAPALVVGVVLVTSFSAAEESPPLQIASRWVGAVRAHQAGKVDPALLEVAGWESEQFRAVLRDLQKALAVLPDVRARNDVLRRGVLLHTDIALLTPERAATFTRLPEPPRSWADIRQPPRTSRPGPVVVGADGQFLRSELVTAHWELARTLVEQIRPDPSNDPFVVRWYRATTALFERAYHLGFAEPHLQRARKVLPKDPWILLYSGALYEADAAPRFRNIYATQPARTPRPSARADLEDALRYYRAAAEADPSFAEAHLRMGRTLGLLGRHDEALAAVRRALALSDDPILQYYAELFAGAHLEALRRPSDAREAFERAAALYPTSQAPLVALSELARRFGDRPGALAALQRLANLPDDVEDRVDPWWIYLRSFAWNAETLVHEMRRSLPEERTR